MFLKLELPMNIQTIKAVWIKKVSIEGFNIIDPKGDTIVYAGTVKASYQLLPLMRNKVIFNEADFSEIDVKLLMNYDSRNYTIAEAFKKKNWKKHVDPRKKKSNWEIEIKKGDLKSVHFLMEDSLSGIHIRQEVDELNIKKFKLAMLERELFAHTIKLSKVQGNTKLTPRLSDKNRSTYNAKSPWIFDVGTLAMNDIDVTYYQTSDSLFLNLVMEKGVIEAKQMDIPGKIIDIEEISIEGASAGIYTNLASNKPSDSDKSQDKDFSWDIKTKKVNLKEVDFSTGSYALHQADSSTQGIGFEDIEMSLRDFQMSPAHTSMDLKKLSFDSNNGFTLKQMRADLDSDSKTTKLNLALETGNSQISMEGEAHGSFFDLIRDPSGIGNAHLVIDNSLISLHDISTFGPSLKDIPAFALHTGSPFSLDIRLDKEKNAINLAKFSLIQSQNFNLSLNGEIKQPFDPSNISGEMNLELSEINTPWLKELLSGVGIQIQVPDSTELSLVATISHHLRSPEIALQLLSNFGEIQVVGNLDLDNKSYYLDSQIEHLHLGDILSIESLGSVSGSAKIEGVGLNAETNETRIDVNIDSLSYEGHYYTQTSINGLLRSGEYEFDLQARDPFINGSLNLDFMRTDSLFIANAKGKLFAQLDHLHFFGDTMAIISDFRATLVKEKKGLETSIIMDSIMLATPLDSIEIQQLSAIFRTDSVRTWVSGEADFFNLELQLEKSFSELSTLSESYGNYLKSFVDPSYSISATRVSELPGLYATCNITNHQALDALFQDTGFNVASLNVSIINEPSRNRVNYRITGSEISYRSAKVGNLNMALTDSATVVDLEAHADSISLFSGPLNSFHLSSQLTYLNSITELSILDLHDDIVYDIEIESEIDSNLMSLRIPRQQIILNREHWNLDSPDFLTIDLETQQLSPALRMQVDSSFLQVVTNEGLEDHTYQIHLNQVNIKSLMWEDLLTEKPEGTITGSIFLGKNDKSEKKISTDLRVKDAKIANLGFNDIHIDGYAAFSDSVDFSTKLIVLFDSSTFKLESEKVDNQHLYVNAEFFQLPLKTIQPITRDYLSNMAGDISGYFHISSQAISEKVTGKLMFNDAKMRVTPLNTMFKIPDQSILFEDDRMVFNNFTVLDSLDKSLLVNGFIDFREQHIFTDLNISSSKLQLMNTTERDNEAFHGNIFIDSKISLKGPLTNPNIEANILLARGTKLNFSSSDNLNLSASSELVNFTSLTEADEQIVVPSIAKLNSSDMSLVETIIEIDPTTQINFNLTRRIFNVNLQIQGGGLLNYNILNDNQASLSGRYEISAGSALLNIIGWPKKDFEISRGGYLNWNGNLEDPELKFEALNKVSSSYTNPVDGMLRDVDLNVALLFSRHLSDLDVKFTISTSDQYVMSIINTLSPEEQMRQAITILLFETIDLPGISSHSGYMTQQVNSILSTQLNQLSKSTFKGVDISFGIDSYSQLNQAGEKKTTTSLAYEVEKSLLNNRAKIEVSGRLQSPNELAGTPDQPLNNFSFEYQLDSAETKYIKVYNEQTYEDVFEGQVTKTGIGFSYRKPYRTFGEIWKRKKSRKKGHKEEKRELD